MYFRVSLLLSREPPRSRADDDHRFPAFRESRPATNRHSSRLPHTSQVASLRVSVDVFSCGREAASASRVAPLAARTGGVVVAEEDFGDAFARDLAAAAARPTPRDATLTVRASKGVHVARLVGAADVMSAEDAARATGAAGRGEAARAAAAFALRGADGCESVRFRFRFRFRFPASRPRRLTSPPPQCSHASEASGQTASRDPTSESPAKSSPRSRARKGFVRSPHSSRKERFFVFVARGLPARLPKTTGSELNGCARTTHPGRFTESRASSTSVGAWFHEERHISFFSTRRSRARPDSRRVRFRQSYAFSYILYAFRAAKRSD